MAVRTDPTDNGGLFVGRRPGTKPVRYRDIPEEATRRRRRIDNGVAHAILALMVVIAATFWGPIPTAWLWVGAQLQYHTDSVMLGICAAFAGMLATIMGGLAFVKRLDGFWILARRAAGHDQRSGIIGPVFGVAAIIGVTLFTIWLLFIGGLGPSFAPAG